VVILVLITDVCISMY